MRAFLAPTPTPYDPLVWEKLPFPEKCRRVCEAWALQGYGVPLPVLVVYALKVWGYVAAWAFFCRFTPGLGQWSDFSSWWSNPIAFQKAILWSMAFEGLGLGCGSGPLTGRYVPPIGGFLYWLRPGTTKAPLFPGAPLIGGHRRGLLEVLLYSAWLALLARALTSAQPTVSELWPIAVLGAVLGVLDKTLFLAARSEHYWTTLLCFVFASAWVPGAKAVQLALWFWAGVSKLNHHFPAVVAVMMSNSPVYRFAWARRWLYRAYPHDVRPSRLAEVMAHAGTALELGVPLVLGLSSGGTGTLVGLVMMVALHAFITSSVPMAVPIEWNVMVVYGAFVLFGANAQVGVLSLEPTWLLAALAIPLVLVPLAGNLWPGQVSFLCAMRYYAGNWAYGVWLFEKGSEVKLRKLTKSSAWLYDQLDLFYPRPVSVGLAGRVLGFRAMHLHGRLLKHLLPKAVSDLQRYEYVEGELVAGLALGWNFGDGHLHDERLVRALQAQCGFAPGEVRCLFVESQPLFGSSLAWRIVDAATGEVERGETKVSQLREEQPWPER